MFDNLSTGKEVVILAMDLSSKYVHLTTSSIYNATRVHHKICRKERDELKAELAEIDKQLQIVYAKAVNSAGFKGGFGGGSWGGGGASGTGDF